MGKHVIFLKKVSKFLLFCLSVIICSTVIATPVPTTVDMPYLEGLYPTYPKTLDGVTPEETALIKKGEYLAKMGDCIACHSNTKENGLPYAGGLALKTPFGTFYTPNITPDKETGIGNWSETDFVRALKNGRDPHGRNYFPVFPYIYFSKMTDDDAKALYAYMMHIPPVNQQNKALPFPFGVPGARFSLWGWNMLFFFPDNEGIPYDNEKSAAWNRGRYIVDSLGHCSMCHTPLTALGSPKKRYYLTGGFIDGYWAPNITAQGLKQADLNEIVKVFSHNQLINQAGPVAGPMAEVNHNSLSQLSVDDQRAIVEYLLTVESEEPNGLNPSQQKPTLIRGRQVYLKACAICHQEGMMSAPIIGSSGNWYERLKQNGLSGFYRHVIYGYNSMPVNGACVTCSENDIVASVNYILNESLTRAQWIDVEKGGTKQFPASGKAIYDENCSVCHTTGTMGAPKLGDKKAWAPILQNEFDYLIKDIMSGKAHPSNAGCKSCSTDEIVEAVKYIATQSSDGNYTLW